MMQAQKKLLYVVLICVFYLSQTVCSQRAIVSLGKRIQQRFSGNKRHISDSHEGEQRHDNSITRRHLAGVTTLLLVVLGYYSQKRFAGGGEFADLKTCCRATS